MPGVHVLGAPSQLPALWLPAQPQQPRGSGGRWSAAGAPETSQGGCGSPSWRPGSLLGLCPQLAGALPPTLPMGCAHHSYAPHAPQQPPQAGLPAGPPAPLVLRGLQRPPHALVGPAQVQQDHQLAVCRTQAGEGGMQAGVSGAVTTETAPAARGLGVNCRPFSWSLAAGALRTLSASGAHTRLSLLVLRGPSMPRPAPSTPPRPGIWLGPGTGRGVGRPDPHTL